MVYLYDSTFDGLLTCIYSHYYTNKVNKIFAEKNYQYTLMEEYEIIETDQQKAKKVFDAIKKKISSEALRHINYVFLSNDINKDTYILKYVELGFKLGRQLDDYHTNDSVLPVHKLSKKVGFETHRFLGLIRFVDVNGVLYSVIEPDHDIITLLVLHFKDRLKNERFIIHDKKRKTAVIYSEDQWYHTDFTLDNNIPISDNELFYQNLWKKYFIQVAIESRKNLRLQQQFVPKKYRKNLTEFRNML